VETRRIYDLIYLGTSVRYLETCTASYIIWGDGFVDYNITKTLSEISAVGLPVTEATTPGLRNLQAKLRAETPDDSHNPPIDRATLGKEYATELKKSADRIRTVLDSETLTILTYIVRGTRHDPSKLLGDIGSLMAPGIFGKLPELVKFDLREAGSCLAFDRPTAAAFHLMRAVEGELRLFYSAWVKQKRIAEPRMWGPMTDHMRTRSNHPPILVLVNLDYVRRNFRNPTQHPDKVYEMDEALDLFAVVCEAITRMTGNFPA